MASMVFHDDEPRGHSHERRDGPAGRERRHGRHRHRRRRKEHVLHTRISDDLADDIRRVADDLRVPVSNLVRNVLEETFSVVESVTDNVGELLEEVIDEAEAARERIRRRQRRRRPAEDAREAPSGAAGEDEDAPRDPLGDVLGWQPVVLHRPRRCDACGTPQPAGARAHLGVTERGVGPATLCEACLAGLHA